ncbi:MAG: hypothetical protein HKP61_17655 [Dactylosporangium sp.]|nr:hypothetical protein [Dactylosporangium sp.]NNJ62724.1 hypothetical protein [Dactylosporangium sp.]
MPAVYNNVTYDTTQTGTSPFADTYGASFDGSSSYVRFDNSMENVPAFDGSIELWFKTPAGHAASGVLYSYQCSETGR